MGVGVFYDNEGLTFICDPFEGVEYEGGDYQFECDMAWEDFLENFLYALPKSWEINFPHKDYTSIGNEYAYNGLYSLFIKQCESGNGNVYVTIRARESVKEDYFNGDANTLNLAIANMHKAMNKVAHSVAPDVGPLRRRTSGWTSSYFWDFEPVTFKAFHF